MLRRQVKNQKLPQTREEKEEYLKKHELLEWLETFAIAGALLTVITLFFLQAVIVDGSSMNPTLVDGERLFVTPCYTELNYKDIIVAERDGEPPIIKRVIATEGQKVDIDLESGKVIVDGKPLEETYIKDTTISNGGDRSIGFPTEVPEGHVFVMGDNREFSLDSRYRDVGMIPVNHVLGKVWIRIFPFTEFGPIEPTIR